MQRAAVRTSGLWSPRTLGVSLTLLLALLLFGCGGGQQQEGAQQQEEAGQQQQEEAGEQGADTGQGGDQPPSDDQAQESGQTQEGGQTQESAQTGDEPLTAAGEPAEIRDGVWTVGDGGEVEFNFRNGALEFVDARPNSGWQVEVDDQSSDEIEVYFRQDNVEWKIEIETDDSNTAEIEIDQEIRGARDGVYEVGNAGEVEFTNEGGRLTLVDARANEGWNVVIDEEDADEIEVDFTRENVRWDFDAEIDDGRLDVDIQQDITGPIPN